MIRKVVRSAVLFVACTALIALAALGYRALRQSQIAADLAIKTPNGIQEAMYVPLGGIDQWVEIRGEDRHNPVILFLHGGPGGSITPLSQTFRSWEKDFTVVLWDQRCAGKTFVRNGADSCPGMSIASVAGDGIELTAFLKRHLEADRVILLGHSWGTMIGVRMIKERPDLFAAYVGTGQVASIAEKEAQIYQATLDKLRTAGDEAGAARLRQVGPPPYATFRGEQVERDLSEKFDIPAERDLRETMTPIALFAPGWSLWELYQTFEVAQDHAEQATFDADAGYDARQLGPEFGVPIYMLNGEFDSVTPTDLAQSYFETIRAPAKEFIVLKGAGHSAVLTDSQDFIDEVKARVLPQLAPSPSTLLAPAPT